MAFHIEPLLLLQLVTLLLLVNLIEDRRGLLLRLKSRLL
jgi:hypothetical protein